MIDRQNLIDNVGFYELPFENIGSSLIYDLTRGRYLSFTSIGTPNEMLFLAQKERMTNDSKTVTDIIVLSNFDYDGYLSLDKLMSVINSFERIKK